MSTVVPGKHSQSLSVCPAVAFINIDPVEMSGNDR